VHFIGTHRFHGQAYLEATKAVIASLMQARSLDAAA
jgi:hypothetical protein